MMKTLFLQPPSFDGFDGGAGSRYQARREIKSFWFPTWLAQPAALVPGSKLIDAPPARLSLDACLAAGRAITSWRSCTPRRRPSPPTSRSPQALKDVNPTLKIGFVGAKVAVEAEQSLASGAGDRFRRPQRIRLHHQGGRRGPRTAPTIDGLSYRNAAGEIVAQPGPRAVLEDMDQLPFVTEVYKRDLRIEDYFIGYLMHPYVSLYTGRGCKSRCTFCLWPQTVGGHRYRVRSVEHVVEEIALAKSYFPQVREFFFDDDTFTDNLPRAEAIARELGKLGVTWSCNAKANVPRDDAEGAAATTGCGCCWSATRAATSRSCTTSRRACGSTWRAGSPRTATSSASRSTAPSSSACRARPRRRSRRRSGSPPRSTRTRSRCRWPRPIPAPYLYRQAVRERLARRRPRRTGRRQRRADRAAALSASVAHRDLRNRSRRSTSASISAAEDRLDRRRDGAEPADDEAAAARGRRVLPVPARPGDGGLRRLPRQLIVCADDFGRDVAVNEAVERAHRDGILTCASLMVARARRGRRGGARAAAAGSRGRAASRAGRRRAGSPPAEVPALLGRGGRFLDNEVLRRHPVLLPAGGTAAARGGDPRPVRRLCRDRPAARPCQRAQAHPPAPDRRAADGRDRPRIRDAGDAPARRAGGAAAAGVSRRALSCAALSALPSRRCGGGCGGRGSSPTIRSSASRGAGAWSRRGCLPCCRICPTGVSEIYAHPAVAPARLVPGYRHAEELAALVSPAVRRRIAELGIGLTSYGEVAPRA